MFLFLLITVGNRDSRYRSGVAAQEEERHVAGSGHQVDQHGHADSTQSWQVQLLHQQPPEEDTQTGTGDGCHACRGQDKGVGFAFTLKSQCSSTVFSSINTFSFNAKFVFPFIYFLLFYLYLDCQIAMLFSPSLVHSNSIKITAWSLFLCKNNIDINSTLLLCSCFLFGLKWRTTLRRTTVHSTGIAIGLPSSWLAEEVVRLNCCSRYFPKKAAKPATTAISMQAASVMQLNTGLERRCLVTRGITAAMEDMQRKIGKKDRIWDSKKTGNGCQKKTWVSPSHLSDAHKLTVRCLYQSHGWLLWVWIPGTPYWGKKATWPAHSPLQHPCPARPALGGNRTWRGPTGRVRHHRGGSRPTTPRSSEGHLAWCPAYLRRRKASDQYIQQFI